MSSAQNTMAEIQTPNLSDYPETDEGGVEFVKDIFLSMGGTVKEPDPPHRPKRILDPPPDSFMMDFDFFLSRT